ncbi:MAG: FAD-binding oxidoreductase [Pseudanabaenaceae cyanobacterium bins.68]|nr:FAD-binding oxidoreductase [Pseudanabaenaceae cyanobacterium bins.68]
MSSLVNYLPEVVAEFYPETATEVASAIHHANQNTWAIAPYGNGSKLDWGGEIKSSLPLCAISTAKLNRLIDHAAGDLTVTVETGMTYGELQDILAQQGQFLAIDPPLAAAATIGGILATGCSGAWRHRYLSVRDMCLGLSMVRADGEIVKAGGRVVKNVAGYDLMKLLTGSYGSLGIITQVTLRVYPRPPRAQTLIVSGSLAKVASLHQTVLRAALTPTRLEPVAGSWLESLAIQSEAALMVEFSGIPESVQLQAQTLGDLAGELAVLQVQPTIWQDISDWIWQPGQAIAKIGLLPSQFVPTWTKIHAVLAGSPTTLQGGWLSISDQVTAVQIQQIRQSLTEQGGWLSLLRSPSRVKQELGDVWGYGTDTARIMALLKQKFDPEHRLNPGRV